MIKKLIILSLMVFSMGATTIAQEIERPQPKFWFGLAGAANFNLYSGTTQVFNNDSRSQTAFHDGFGIAPFGAIQLEYTPKPVWGIMLNLGYDGRGGAFDGVIEPCNCPADLTTNLSYFVVEPSLRISPFSNGFHLFVGGAFNYNYNKAFKFTQERQIVDPPITDATPIVAEGDFSDIRTSLFSAQVGMGYDIPLSSKENLTQVKLSPFVSYHPYFGREPRNVESWSIQTVRAGIALKIGRASKPTISNANTLAPGTVVATDPNADFSVKAPASIPVRKVVKESFPLRNYVFFSENSNEIPKRYVQLNSKQAMEFTENTFQEAEPVSVEGRSKRQMHAYYNILNILGDRMRDNPTSSVTLIGSSAGKGAAAGKEYAESIKKYLVDVYGISATRISTEGRDMPIIPSGQPGGTIDLTMLQEGDRRVDIVSNSAILLAPLQITTVLDDPNEGKVVFTTKAQDNDKIKTWTIDVIDEQSNVQHFGPFTGDQASVSANTILGNRHDGTYKVVMNAQTDKGRIIQEESTLRLVHDNVVEQTELRFSVLFDFDKSETVASYEKFLNETVAPQIMDYSTVIIHGHTDVIGDATYNMTLSQERAKDAQDILQSALTKLVKKGVKFQSSGYGDKTDFAPFGNKLPEERFYNRTVIIDIVLAK